MPEEKKPEPESEPKTVSDGEWVVPDPSEHLTAMPIVLNLGLTPEELMARQRLYLWAYKNARERVAKQDKEFLEQFDLDFGGGI